MHKRNNAVPKKGRKPIVSKRNGQAIARSSAGIRSVVGQIAKTGLTAAARAVMGSIFGQGDYTVKYNTLTNAGGPPQFTSSNGGRSFVAIHREFIQDITGTTNFSLQSFPISPTNNNLFPWLSQIASNFEEYRIHGMVYEFKTTSGAAVSSTNTALGTVIMATQYNPNDTPFSNKIEMENYEFCTSGGPFENFLHAIECKPQLTVAPQLYVNQPTSAGAVVDPRLTNFGTFNIATVGMQASNVIGELWVSYYVELLKPRISSLILGSGGARVVFQTGLSSANPFGTVGGAASAWSTYAATNGERSVFNPGTTGLSRTDNAGQLNGTPGPGGLTFSAGGVITLPSNIQPGHTLRLAMVFSGTGLSSNPILTPTAGTGPTVTTLDFTNLISSDSTLRFFEIIFVVNSLGDRTLSVSLAATALSSTQTYLVFLN